MRSWSQAHTKTQYMRHLHSGKEFFDDVHGKWLEKERAIEARRLELKFFRKMGVYTKVPRKEAGNSKVITIRWIDVDKGDAENPNYRSRLVGWEIKKDKRPDPFAATPPLESLRYIIRKCASNQKLGARYCILRSDMKRAYFYASAIRPVFIVIPVEDRQPEDEGMVGRLNLSLYCIRDAAQNWQKECTGFMQSLGFIVGRASPCNFHRPKMNITCAVHGDDFTSRGPEWVIEWFRKRLADKYECKHDILGPGPKHSKSIRVLNRVRAWTHKGIAYEANRRHVDIVVQELGPSDAKSVTTPHSKKDTDKILSDLGKPLPPQEATMYRALAARLNHIALDKADVQFATNEVAKHMATPHPAHWNIFKRVGRYLLCAPRLVQMFTWQSQETQICTYIDSDWAGGKVTRKSISGGIMFVGCHAIKFWSSNQTNIAFSCAEAELYALLKGAN